MSKVDDGPETDWLSADQLVALASEHGYRVSRDQLRDLHLLGFIPRPEQRHRPGRVGSETIYPPATADRLLAYCRIHQKKKLHNEVAWLMWWEGHDVELAMVRAHLTKVATPLDAAITKMRQQFARDEAIDSLATTNLRSHPVGWIRRRLGASGPGSFQTIIGSTMRSMLGIPPTMSDSDIETLERGIGRDEAGGVRIRGHEVWTSGSLVEAISWMSHLLSTPLADGIGQLGDDELAAARDDALIFL